MRFFNIGGSCNPRFHYMLPAVERLPEASALVDRGAYFTIYSASPTGKTTTGERVRLEPATSPAGRAVTVLHAA